MNNLKIKFIVVAVVVTLRQLLAASAVRFWRPAKFKNLANSDFENLKHWQNLETLSLTEPYLRQKSPTGY